MPLLALYNSSSGRLPKVVDDPLGSGVHFVLCRKCSDIPLDSIVHFAYRRRWKKVGVVVKEPVLVRNVGMEWQWPAVSGAYRVFQCSLFVANCMGFGRSLASLIVPAAYCESRFSARVFESATGFLP